MQVISGDPDYGNYFLAAVNDGERKNYSTVAPKHVLISLVGKTAI